MVLAESLAISAAFLWGLAAIALRRGLVNSNTWTALAFSLPMAPPLSLVLVMLAGESLNLSTQAILFFVVSGLVALGARGISFLSIDRVGASVSTTLLGTKPFFASLIAITLLGEEMTIQIALGTMLIFIGITILHLGRERGRTFQKRHLLLPITASAGFAIFDILVRVGVLFSNSPLAGSFYSAIGGLVVFSAVVIPTRKRMIKTNSKSIKHFAVAGFAITAAIAAQFIALSLGNVIIIAPLTSTMPFFAVILAAMFLRDLERVGQRTLFSALFIVAGAVMIVFRW
mgnify:CR=1 FL=1